VKVVERVNGTLFFYLSILTVVLTLVVVYGVVTRYFIGRADPRAFFFSVWLYGLTAILAGGYVLAVGGRASVNVLYSRVGKRMRDSLDILALVVVVVACVLVLIPGVQISWRSTLINE
jgi:TRAP-type mannitol/chloroaromatic compound transport system permease small subunit